MAKFGEGHLAAMARLGLKELRNAMNPSRESVADTEVGLFGTQTQGEIAQARGGAGQGLEQESKLTLEGLREFAKEHRAKQAEQNLQHGHEKERDRGGVEM